MKYILILLFSATLMYFATKWSILLSKKFNFIDQPSGRKVHPKPTPTLGGFAFISTILVSMGMFNIWQTPAIIVGLVGAIGIFLIGLYDDKYVFSPLIKLSLQFLLITCLYFSGIRIEFITFPSAIAPVFFNSITSFFVTQVWMLVIMNMFNIIDGIDGLAVGISFVTAIGLFFVSLTVSPMVITLLLCSIIGSTGMFLKFNFHPAKIFLGDSGALLLGYLFSIISILGVLKSAVSFIVLVFIFAVPLMDFILSILRRLLKRKNIFYPDLEHMHHQLVNRGISIRKTSILFYLISGIFAVIAVISASNSNAIKIITGLILFLLIAIVFFRLQFKKNSL